MGTIDGTQGQPPGRKLRDRKKAQECDPLGLAQAGQLAPASMGLGPGTMVPEGKAGRHAGVGKRGPPWQNPGSRSQQGTPWEPLPGAPHS